MKNTFRVEPTYDEVRMSIPDTYGHRQSLFSFFLSEARSKLEITLNQVLD
jgi:hypothetical protein